MFFSKRNRIIKKAVTKVVAETIYVEEYDPETNLYFGMQVYLEYAIIDNLIINYLLLNVSAVCSRVRTSFFKKRLSYCHL